MSRSTRRSHTDLFHQESVAAWTAPAEPEFRLERPSSPNPLQTPADWQRAWAEAVANDPTTREMLGLP